MGAGSPPLGLKEKTTLTCGGEPAPICQWTNREFTHSLVLDNETGYTN